MVTADFRESETQEFISLSPVMRIFFSDFPFTSVLETIKFRFRAGILATTITCAPSFPRLNSFKPD